MLGLYPLKSSSIDWEVSILHWKTKESIEAIAAHRTDVEPDNHASDIETVGLSDTHGGQVAFRLVLSSRYHMFN